MERHLLRILLRSIDRIACACRVLLLVISVMTLPCVAQPQPAASQPASDATPAGAELYLFNDSGRTLIPSNQVITDGGKPLASLPRQTFVKLTLAPGSHVLKPEPPLWKQEVKLEAVPGSRHFVVVAYRPERSWAMPLGGAPLILREITEEQAATLMRDMKPQ